MNWYLSVLKQYFDFNGRSRRKEFWFFTLISSLISIFFICIDQLLGTLNYDLGLGILSGVYALLVFIPSLSVLFRRLHDTGRTGWWFLITFIPLIGPIVLLVFLVQDSQDENEYGRSPKALVLDLN